MPWLRHLAVLFAFLAALVRPAPASAFTPASPESRVGASDFSRYLLAGDFGAASREQHQGFGAAYGENASDYRLAAEGVVTAGESAAARGATSSFFEGTSYSAKVLRQMEGGVGEFHSFPESVTAFESAGATRAITGGDGIVREMIEIPGSYGSREGVFQFIKEADGTINHRLFVPTAP